MGHYRKGEITWALYVLLTRSFAAYYENVNIYGKETVIRFNGDSSARLLYGLRDRNSRRIAMNYKNYAKSKDTPSRKLRKSQRNTVFSFNRKLSKLSKRPRSLAR